MSKRDKIYWALAAPAAVFLAWVMLELTPAEPWGAAFVLYLLWFLLLFAVAARFGKTKRDGCTHTK